MRKLFVLILPFLFLLALPAAAQVPPIAPVIAYVEDHTGGGISGSLVVITDAGITETIPIPPGVYPTPSVRVSEVKVSPDRRWVALSMSDPITGIAYPITVADLTLQTCCVQVVGNVASPLAYDLAGFDPSGQYLALAYVGTPADPAVFQYGGFMVFDVENASPYLDLPATTFFNEGAWALMGHWGADGNVRLHPNCYACGGVIEGEWHLWNPFTGTFSPTSGESFSAFGAALPATGEFLVLNQITGYPYDPREGMFPAPNVVQYFADGVLPPSFPPELRAGAPVVGFEPGDINLDDDQVTWINDGEAFLISDSNSPVWTAVSRSGGQRNVPVAVGSQVIAGTVDGWIVAEPGNAGTVLARYLLLSGEYQRLPLGTVIGAVTGVSGPDLGTSLGEAPPPFIPVPVPAAGSPASPAGAFSCDGVFVQPRLVAGGLGQVTPGLPNNLRSQPSTAGALLGQIPANGVFNVLEGPLCNQTFIWWRVQYNGVQGYTVEATTDQYFVNPL